MFVAAVILVPTYLRHQDKQRMYETMKIAFERGQPIPPEMLTQMQNSMAPGRPSTPETDLRRAIVLIAVGLGLCGLGYGMWYGLMSVSDTAAYITGGAIAGSGAIPGFIGIAHLILWATGREKTRV